MKNTRKSAKLVKSLCIGGALAVLFTAIVLLTFVPTADAAITWSSELLTNPGFETGDATGWINAGGGGVNIGAQCTSCDDGPHTGSYQAYWNSSNSAYYLYQTVDLSSYAADIDAGNAPISATGWLISNESPAQDLFFMQVRFYDGPGGTGTEIIADRYNTGTQDVATWGQYGITDYTIPATTRSVLIGFNTWEVGWDAGSADDFSVKVGVASAGTISQVSNWTTGLSHTVGGSVDTDRLLVFVTGFENSGDTAITGVTYGGQAMTSAVQHVTTAAGYVTRCEIWYLNETGIQAASGTTFVVTYASGAPTDPMHAAATFQNVDQINPIGDSAKEQSSAGYNPDVDPIEATVNVVQEGMAIAGAVCGNDGSYSWGNGWTERTDQTSAATTTMATAGHSVTAAGTDTASADHSSIINRQVIVVASLAPLPIPGGIKIQRGSTVITGTSATATAPTDFEAVASLSRAFVRIVSAQASGTGDGSTGAINIGPNEVTATVEFTDTSTITFTRSTTSGDCRLYWEIWEYTGAHGGDNEFIVRGQGVSNELTSLLTSVDMAVSGVSTVNDCVVFLTGVRNSSSNVLDYFAHTFHAYLLDQTTVRIERQATGVSVWGSYAVVEFTGANWTVQSGTHTFTAAGATETETITAVSATDKAFLITQHKTNQNGLDDYGYQAWISGTGTVSFRLRSTADVPSSHIMRYWVAESSAPDFLVRRGSFTIPDSLNDNELIHNETITEVDDLSHTALTFNHDTNGTGTAFPRACRIARLTSDTNLEVYCSRGNQPSDCRYETIEFPGATFRWRKPITIDYTKVSASCSSDLSDFPVLISIDNDSDLRDHVINADGHDIIFRATDDDTCGGVGTAPCTLDHEIEYWDGSTGTLVAWVRVPTLKYDQNTDIYIYYGNSSISSSTENATGVWDINYVGVWHLSESPNDGVAGHVDSTGNPNVGTPQNFQDGAGSTNATGKIGGADYFAGDNDYVDCGNNAILNVNYLTVELWININSWVSDGGILAKGDNTYRQYWMWTYGGAGSFTVDNIGAINDAWLPQLGEWHHLVLTYDGSNVITYKNGVQENIYPQTTGVIDSQAPNLFFGYIPNYNYFDGSLDEVRITNGARDLCWIQTEYNNQKWPNKADWPADGFITVGSEEYGPATAVSLLSFTATGQGASIRVEWQTGREVDNMGFYLYRSGSPWGAFTRLTDKLIPGLTFSVMKKAYTYEDTDVTLGVLYYYKLEDIDVYGRSTFHGPICVDWDMDSMPDDWEIAYGLNPALDDSAIDADGDGLSNLEEYDWETDPLNPDTDGDGIPDVQEDGRIDHDTTTSTRTLTRGVEIISSDDTGITLELRTDAFDMEIVEHEGKAFERLRILDYIHGFTQAVGRPELPVKGVLVDLPEWKSATLQVKETEGQTLSGYWVYPVPEKAVHGEGDLAHVAEIFAMDEAAYSTDVLYPNEVARLGENYIFRGQQKLQVIFYPLAFNPKTKEVMHYTRIRVRVTYEDAQERSSVERLLMAAMAEPSDITALAWTPPSEEPGYKILVSEEGIYRITSDSGLDVDAMDLSQVRLYNLGQEVAISVHDGAGDDYIEFYGRPVETQYAKYATYNVYWLTTSGGSGDPKRMTPIDGSLGSGAVPVTHTFTVHYEEDQGYWILAPGGDSLDRWFFDPNVYPVWGDGIEGGGDPVDFPLSLPGVAGQGSLKISMGGVYDTDHEVDVFVNGTPVGTFTWSGIAFYQATIDDADLLEGDNTVTIECESGIDEIVVDWFEVEYPRDFAASNNTLKFSHQAGYHYQISGFTGSDPVAFDITSPGDVQRIAGQITGTSPCTLDFEHPGVTGERTYLALSSDAVETPSGISQDTASTLSDQANGADYILITHTDLGWDGTGQPHAWLSDLVSLRESQGLRVKVVDVADIYDEFSYGIATPQAVKDFLAYAYNNWTQPAPQYVLLVGDSTYDAKNNWSWKGQEYTDTTTYLPTYLTFTTSIDYMGETVTDEWFVRVSGDDAIPDMYIGRLPATSVDQAALMVNKIITYETATNTKTWEKNVLLIADNQTRDYEAVFEAMNEDAAAFIPTGLNAPFKGYLGDYVSEAYLTDDIKEKINEGTLVVNFSGHGSTQIWAHEHIFENGDVADLTNDEMLPFFVSMSCFTGYFADPDTWDFPSMTEVLLRSEGKGAVAAFMPTGMTSPEGQHILDAALFDAIFTEDIRTLGTAISHSKQTLLANGSHYEQVSETFLLFGDPAMTLKVPLPRRPTGLMEQGQDGSVTLSWQGAADANGGAVSGYNIYRATASGGAYTKLNSSLITVTSYHDTGLTNGTPYYYVVTSVDADGDESVRSQEVSVRPIAGQASGLTVSGSRSSCFISSAAESWGSNL